MGIFACTNCLRNKVNVEVHPGGVCDAVRLALRPDLGVIIAVGSALTRGSTEERGMSRGSESSTRVIIFRNQQRVELKVKGTWFVDFGRSCRTSAPAAPLPIPLVPVYLDIPSNSGPLGSTAVRLQVPALVTDVGQKYSFVGWLRRVGDIERLGPWGSCILQGGCVLHRAARCLYL